MIKRLIGFLVTVAVLAVVVLTVLHRDRFRTMLRIGEPSEQPVVPRDTLPASAPTEQTLPDAADGQAPGSGRFALCCGIRDSGHAFVIRRNLPIYNIRKAATCERSPPFLCDPDSVNSI